MMQNEEYNECQYVLLTSPRVRGRKKKMRVRLKVYHITKVKNGGVTSMSVSKSPSLRYV